MEREGRRCSHHEEEGGGVDPEVALGAGEGQEEAGLVSSADFCLVSEVNDVIGVCVCV